jgi:glycosyltransferase involved in cell wall biosynthesis
MLHVGDAVGRHTVALRSLLRSRGVNSEIYVELEDPETAGETRMAASYSADAVPGDLLVYQFATASDLVDWVAERPEPLVVNYHNVTPPPFFAPWDDVLARHQVRARRELGHLAQRAVLGVAVSELNRTDLVQEGFTATAVVPPIVELPAGTAGGDRAARPRGSRWLAVGRLAPNKKVEDVIAALLAYRARFDADAELEVVGRAALSSYSTALRRYAADLGLADAVHFRGRVDEQDLDRAYAAADVLVVCSEHEGFCLPVVEAMARGLPVVAFAEGALGEVLGTAGVLLERKDPLTVAEAVHRVQTDATMRSALVAAGLKRPAELGLAGAGERLVELLVAASNRGPWPDGVRVAAGRPAVR